MFRVKFGELRIGPTAKKNLQQVIDTNWASEGPLVARFETEWSKKFGYKHSVSMSSGTDADINACLVAYKYGAQRGDEIICPALTFIATANSILAAGFVPKFVDIDRKTLNIDVSRIEEKITSRTRAIMCTWTMGKPCNMDVIMDIAERYNLIVISDACEAHGAKYKGGYPGDFGDIATFSFFTAHIVVAGEGGMCSTNNEEYAYLMRSTKSHGRVPGSNYFDHQRFGLNSKMNDLEAAIGLEGLENFDATMKSRCENKRLLTSLLHGLQDRITLDHQEEHEFISPHAFPMVLTQDSKVLRDELYSYLEDAGIQCKTLFGSVPTQQTAFSFMRHNEGEFPQAEFVGRNGLHIGIHQYLTKEDIEYVADRLHYFFKR